MLNHLSRSLPVTGNLAKGLLAALVLAAAAASLAGPAAAQERLRVDITQGNIQPISIAVTDFASDGKIGADISAVVAADLKRSGLFQPIDRKAFIEQISDPDTPPRFADWRVINTQALVAGRVTKEGDGRLRAQFRLWDVVSGQQMTGQQYFADPGTWRRVRVGHLLDEGLLVDRLE